MDRRALTVAAWRGLEAVHVVCYFAPESTAALAATGLRGTWMRYFASRACALGTAGPELVTSTFYNFSPAHVAKAIPDAWSFAAPADVAAARLAGSIADLRQLLAGVGDDESVATAADLAQRAAESAPLEGRPLFAALRQLPWPSDPLGRLWHAATLLREQRGDGHIAALVAAGIGGRLSNVVTALYDGTPPPVVAAMRQYDDTEWATLLDELVARGWATTTAPGEGALTDEGRRVRDEIEDTTDAIAEQAYAALDDAELATLVELVTPMAAAIRASNVLPPVQPKQGRP